MTCRWLSLTSTSEKPLKAAVGGGGAHTSTGVPSGSPAGFSRRGGGRTPSQGLQGERGGRPYALLLGAEPMLQAVSRRKDVARATSGLWIRLR